MIPTPEQIKEWRRLAEAATPGEWEAAHDDDDKLIVRETLGDHCGQWTVATPATNAFYDGDPDPTEANAALIAASRTALPLLLDAIEQLQADVDGMARVLVNLGRPACQVCPARKTAYCLSIYGTCEVRVAAALGINLPSLLAKYAPKEADRG